jgi:hypothetical protein
MTDNGQQQQPEKEAAARETVQLEVVAHTVPAQKDGEPGSKSRSVLVIDIGGTKVKMLVTGKTAPHKATSGPDFTPERLVRLVRTLEPDWKFDAVTIGFPGLVGTDGPKSEPGNLGPGWVGFDFASALNVPVKIINDAVMQALGSYDKGRMLFLGLGTGIGSALIADYLIVPLELGHLRFDRKRTINDVLNRDALARDGRKTWRQHIDEVVQMILKAFVVDYVVLGGGNAKNIKEPPVGARLGHNRAAFRGGFRLWDDDRGWALAVADAGRIRPEMPKGADGNTPPETEVNREPEARSKGASGSPDRGDSIA